MKQKQLILQVGGHWVECKLPRNQAALAPCQLLLEIIHCFLTGGDSVLSRGSSEYQGSAAARRHKEGQCGCGPNSRDLKYQGRLGGEGARGQDTDLGYFPNTQEPLKVRTCPRESKLRWGPERMNCPGQVRLTPREPQGLMTASHTVGGLSGTGPRMLEFGR